VFAERTKTIAFASDVKHVAKFVTHHFWLTIRDAMCVIVKFIYSVQKMITRLKRANFIVQFTGQDTVVAVAKLLGRNFNVNTVIEKHVVICKFCQEKHTCKCCSKILYEEEWFKCGNEFCLRAYHARCANSMKYKTLDGDWKICLICWEKHPSYELVSSHSRRQRALRKSEIINAGFVWNSLLCKNFKEGWETHAEFERKYRLFEKIGSWDQECEIKFCENVPGKLILRFVHRRQELRKMFEKHAIAYDENESELYRPYFECRPGQELRLLAKITWAKIVVTKIDIPLLRLEAFLCEISISDLLAMKKKVLFQSMFKGSSSWHALL
jgi:hypothetical protein